MLYLSAGHTGPHTGAQCATVAPRFDEGSETIRLRDAVAAVLTTRYHIAVLTDQDTMRLSLLCQQINDAAAFASNIVCVDLHFNASTQATAHGTEVIVADDASDLEVALAVRLLNATARTLGTNRRGVRTESQTPRRRLAILHLDCPSVILEICFATSQTDTDAYRRQFDTLVDQLAQTIAQFINLSL